jgi:hypothetical protein
VDRLLTKAETMGVDCICFDMSDRGVYSVCETAGMTSDGVLSAVESLETQAAAVNKKHGQGGLGVGALSFRN